ncbi:MFS transporter [Cuniculiplasma sp. SKW4]|uniref:MFS transporter n=1 Tax=Cuniculiplasma sp. SKW4 TaxID=3400171 RepID=UPI003FCF793E
MLPNNWKKNSDLFPLTVSSLSILVASFNIATISVALGPLENYININGQQVTYLASAVLIGAIFGAAFSGIISDRFGRIGILALDLLTFVAAGIGSALSTEFYELFLFRLLVGVGVGIDYVVIFAYLSEIEASAGRHGTRLALVMFFANFGILLAYGTGAILSLYFGSISWRYIFIVGAIFPIAPIILRLKIQESEEWKRFHIQSIRSIFRKFMERKNSKDALKFSVPWFLYQISDQSLTLFLPILLVSLIGNSFYSADTGSVIVKLFTIPASLITVIIISKVGRKFLQSTGFFFRSLMLGIMGLLLVENLAVPSYISVLLLGGAFFFGALGPDKTTVIAPAESFSTSVRGTGQGISEMFGRLGGLTGVIAYGYLRLLTPGAGLIFLSITCALGFITTVLFFGWKIEKDQIAQ